MNTFQVKKKNVFFYFFLSFTLHLLFLFILSSIKIHSPLPRSKILVKKEAFEALKAQRQQSLNQTFERFYPIFSKKQGIYSTSSLMEGEMQLDDSNQNAPFSIGEDEYTIINPHFNAPDIFALSFPSDLEGVDLVNLPRNIPLTMPLSLDEAQLKKEIKEASAFLQKGLLNSKPSVNQMLSSKILLAKMNENLNPYHLDMQSPPPNSSALFEKVNIELPLLTFSNKVEDLETFLESEFDKLYTPQLEQTYFPTEAAILSDAFDIEVKKCEMQNGKYTFFSIQLNPKSRIAFEKLNQEFVYLIDRSNSISPDIFQSFKRSVSFSLDILPKNELFNVAIFDSDLHVFSKQTLPIEKANLLRAKTYLETRAHGGLFASTNLFTALEPFLESSDRIRHIFLFSDGDTFLKENIRLKTLLLCLSKNPKINLHCIATGDQNNLSLLQLLSHLNRGEMIYKEQTDKLESVFLHAFSILTSAVATNIVPSIQTIDEEQKIGFFTPSHLMKMIYSKRPFVIYGVATTNSPFELFLQANGKNGVITIKKSIDLKQALQDENIMPLIKQEKEWMSIENKLYENPHLPIHEILD